MIKGIKPKHKHVLLFMLIMWIGLVASAQFPPPPSPTAPPTQVPIDGGVILLAVAGVAYGAKKIYTSKKSR